MNGERFNFPGADEEEAVNRPPRAQKIAI
jgi:hypothetical protein